MKNRINNKLLMATTIASIFMSGCVSKSIEVIDTKVDVKTMPQLKEQKVSKWKSLNKFNKDDCVDCYVDINKEPIKRVATLTPLPKVYNYDYSTAPTDVYENNNVELEEYSNPYLVDEAYSEVDEAYSEYDNKDKSLYAEIENSSEREENKNLLSKNSIQIGAFRKYAGAKVYAKRYSLLTDKYSVDIKENVKDNEPIYRVHIEGFSNENEAQDFMERYGLTGAFLVRR